MVRGVSTRDYEQVSDLVHDGFGVAKSSVSRGFVRASAAQVKALAERRFDGQRFAVVMIDGVEYAGETMIVAIGISADGAKGILGLRQGATENAAVCMELLDDLQQRGLDTTRPTLLVLDGSKALHAAARRLWGQNAVIQRCQVHKKRNVKAHVPEKHLPELDQRLGAAYGETDYEAAKTSLEETARWLTRINPDAAASLREGLEETLTVVRLGVPATLRRTLATTNPIESALSVTRRVTARVTRWRDGDMRKHGVQLGCSGPSPSSGESKATEQCQSFSRLWSHWCEDNGLELSNASRENVPEEPLDFQLGMGHPPEARSAVIPQDFQCLIDRLLSRGLDARFVQMGLDGAIRVLELERETSSGIPTNVRVVYITQLLNGTWRTSDLVELDEGFDESAVANYVERRLKASRADYDAESMRRIDAVGTQKPPDLNLPDPVFRIGEA